VAANTSQNSSSIISLTITLANIYIHQCEKLNFTVSNTFILGILKINCDPLLPISYNDIIDKPVTLQGKDGISTEALAFVTTPTYESNTLTIRDYEVENFGDPENGTAWENIPSFPLTITVTIPKTKITKYGLGSGWPTQSPRDWTSSFYDKKTFKSVPIYGQGKHLIPWNLAIMMLSLLRRV
jgi:hypothetical protein